MHADKPDIGRQLLSKLQGDTVLQDSDTTRDWKNRSLHARRVHRLA